MFLNPQQLIPALVLASLAVVSQARNFTDDRGVVYSWPDDGSAPTVVVNANGAMALFHLGMTNEQIVGVWDKWVIRGSKIDLDSEDLTSVFDADPNRPEVDFLKSVRDLSPGCSASDNGCGITDGVREFDVDILNELAPDFVVYLHHDPYPEITSLIQQSTGQDPIYIDNRFEDNEGCRTTADFAMSEANCYARSVFDVVQRTQELAAFLGVDTESDQIAADQQAMCEAANEFSLMAEQLHSRGVRCLGATARMNGGGNINLVNINQNVWLRTFEELGLPLMHPPLQNPTDYTRTYQAEDWFPGCDRFGGDEYNCDGIEPTLPADCWLFDSRSYPTIAENKDEILSVISVEAIKENQFSSLLLNDGAISLKTAAAILKEVTEDLKNTQRIYDETDCTRVEVTSREHTSLAFGSLEGGAYACYDREALNADMLTCPKGFTPTAPTDSGASESNGESSSDDLPGSSPHSGLESSSGSTQSLVVVMASLIGSLLLLA